uniref:Zona pellucida sperm-binding protein 3 n=1 Tax=Oncorhynchus mykiss TaxID=8022 RepID=A0A8C7T6X6_ONCMY
MPSRNQETSNFISYGPQQQAEELVSTGSRLPTQNLFRPFQTPMPFEQRIPVQIPVQTEHGKPAPSPIPNQQAFQPGKPPVQGRVKFELKNPVSVTSVAVQYRQDVVRVEVKQDFLGNGQLIQPSDLTLGGCTPIVRTNYAEVGVECHYQRKHNVISNALKPTWVPFASTKVAEQQLVFSLRLMTDDWQFVRPSSVYFLGHVMSIEASIIQAHHTTLHVYVDSCVDTLAPEPRYSFIENHGCLTDDPKLYMVLFFLHFLKTPGLVFFPLRWASAGGDDLVCGCCDSTCGLRKGRSLLTDIAQTMMLPPPCLTVGMVCSAVLLLRQT